MGTKMKICAVFAALLSIVDASCYDDNNGGCSHICAGSVCSCPPCWTLNEDGRNCAIESGRATVTCRNDGIDVVIDKCVAADVEQNQIHLKSSECGATEESDTEWKVSTGFADCATEIQIVDEKLAISNTLMIGGAIAGGLRLSNDHEIGFTCKYNNVATASKSFSAATETVVFDINEEAPTDLSFGFNLVPFESDQFATEVDLATQSVQIGNLIHMRAAPVTEMPEALEFSVHKCSVEDTETAAEVTILDSCPVFPGLNFHFKNEQSDQNAVDFSFASFQFQSSEENAVIELKCQINICPVDSAECLQPCSESTTTVTIPPGDVFILVIPNLIDESYLQSGDGSSQISATINAPENADNYYAEYAAHALVNGELHIFGGASDSYKIARLDGCSWNELPSRLNEGRTEDHAALSIENGQKVLVCFGRSGDTRKSCEIFDGSSTALNFTANYTHRSGGLGLYNNQPATVGCYDAEHQKAETLSATGWNALPDHPLQISSHSLVGLDNGAMLLLGGYDWGSGGEAQTGIWQLKEDQWSRIGEFSKPAIDGSTFAVSRSIYFFEYTNSIHRIDIDENDELEAVEEIGIQSGNYWRPVLLQTTNDYCV